MSKLTKDAAARKQYCLRKVCTAMYERTLAHDQRCIRLTALPDERYTLFAMSAFGVDEQQVAAAGGGGGGGGGGGQQPAAFFDMTEGAARAIETSCHGLDPAKGLYVPGYDAKKRYAWLAWDDEASLTPEDRAWLGPLRDRGRIEQHAGLRVRVIDDPHHPCVRAVDGCCLQQMLCAGPGGIAKHAVLGSYNQYGGHVMLVSESDRVVGRGSAETAYMLNLDGLPGLPNRKDKQCVVSGLVTNILMFANSTENDAPRCRKAAAAKRKGSSCAGCGAYDGREPNAVMRCVAIARADGSGKFDVHMVYVATRDIAEGEEILISYGPHYWNVTPGDRVAQLHDELRDAISCALQEASCALQEASCALQEAADAANAAARQREQREQRLHQQRLHQQRLYEQVACAKAELRDAVDAIADRDKRIGGLQYRVDTACAEAAAADGRLLAVMSVLENANAELDEVNLHLEASKQRIEQLEAVAQSAEAAYVAQQAAHQEAVEALTTELQAARSEAERAKADMQAASLRTAELQAAAKSAEAANVAQQAAHQEAVEALTMELQAARSEAERAKADMQAASLLAEELRAVAQSANVVLTTALQAARREAERAKADMKAARREAERAKADMQQAAERAEQAAAAAAESTPDAVASKLRIELQQSRDQLERCKRECDTNAQLLGLKRKFLEEEANAVHTKRPKRPTSSSADADDTSAQVHKCYVLHYGTWVETTSVDRLTTLTCRYTWIKHGEQWMLQQQQQQQGPADVPLMTTGRGHSVVATRRIEKDAVVACYAAGLLLQQDDASSSIVTLPGTSRHRAPGRLALHWRGRYEHFIPGEDVGGTPGAGNVVLAAFLLRDEFRVLAFAKRDIEPGTAVAVSEYSCDTDTISLLSKLACDAASRDAERAVKAAHTIVRRSAEEDFALKFHCMLSRSAHSNFGYKKFANAVLGGIMDGKLKLVVTEANKSVFWRQWFDYEGDNPCKARFVKEVRRITTLLNSTRRAADDSDRMWIEYEPPAPAPAPAPTPAPTPTPTPTPTPSPTPTPTPVNPSAPPQPAEAAA